MYYCFHSFQVELSTGVVISGANAYASDSIDSAAKSIWTSVGQHPAVSSIPQSAAVNNLLTLLARGRSIVENHASKARVFDDYKWLRVKAKGEMTVEHADEFYYHVN